MELEISELYQKFTENSFKDVSMSELSSQIALKACSSLQLIGFGKGVHGYVLKFGFGCCGFVACSLVDMNGKCGVLEDARKVFDIMSERNTLASNLVVVGYVHNGLMNEEAMEVYKAMPLQF
ncbi:hypothetical protein HHK36_021536 [Tetracentron sinense]|uniref:Pentatricopeptide repeat-containing protein n=1 Tax=Tetracentron sinense TaxID=13715 RepID=A0A834YT97_TETSI|nr:hypothetical protein HHK36_021536 [Tetracentron sinense]